MYKNKKGFSLIEALASLTIVTVAVLALLNLNKDSTTSETKGQSQLDYIQLASEFYFILEKDNNCTATFANPTALELTPPYAGALSFEVADLQGDISTAGVFEIQLHTGLANNVRSQLRFEAGTKYGNINVTSVRLIFPDHNSGNLIDGTSSIQAEVYLQGEKRIGATQVMPIRPLRKLILLNLETSAGVSTVRGCGGVNP